jgi:hypothetical protein
MSAVAVAHEADNVRSFIFKKGWSVNNLDKICGQLSSRMTRTAFEGGKGWVLKVVYLEKSQVTRDHSESFRRPEPPSVWP